MVDRDCILLYGLVCMVDVEWNGLVYCLEWIKEVVGKLTLEGQTVNRNFAIK